MLKQVHISCRRLWWKNDKMWYTSVVVNCIRLWTLWMPLYLVGDRVCNQIVSDKLWTELSPILSHSWCQFC